MIHPATTDYRLLKCYERFSYYNKEESLIYKKTFPVK